MPHYQVRANALFGYSYEVEADDVVTACGLALDAVRAGVVEHHVGPAVTLLGVHNLDTGETEKTPHSQVR